MEQALKMVKLIETDAQSIHGTNPPYLLKIIRTRICESKHWKEECFGLTTKLVVDKAMALRLVGSVSLSVIDLERASDSTGEGHHCL